MRYPAWQPWAAVAALVIGLSACGGGGGDDDNNPEPPASTGTVTGTVIDADTGAPLAGAAVTAGDVSTRTDAQGAFTLPNVPTSERAMVRVEADGYAAAFRVTEVAENASRRVEAELLPAAADTVITVSTGGTATVPGSPAQVVLPANALVRPDGTAASGQATVQLTPIDPARNVELMPGDFTASTDAGPRALESYGAMSVEISAADGAELQLAEGRTAVIRIPVATRSDEPPATIPLFHFNEESGRWEEEGSATLSQDGTYYEGTVSHFSIWNADRVYDSVNVIGCVRDEDDAPVAGLQVMSDGIDYSGTSSAVTDAGGRFVIPIKLNARATLGSVTGSRLTNTVSVGPLAAAHTLANCLVLGSEEAALNVKLTWGERPLDVDSHLYLPDGSHIAYHSKGSLIAAPWANLDVDDVTSFGPEVVTVRRLMVGTYLYAVHNYSGTFTPGMTGSPVRVELNTSDSRRVFTARSGETNATRWWSVFTFTVNADCSISVAAVDTWNANAPAPAASTTPVYCEAP